MRKLYSEPRFDRMFDVFIRKNPAYEANVIKVLELLKNDVFDPALKTHRLHGLLKHMYACRLSYDFRIIFTFNKNSIILKALGRHDEIY